MTAGVNSGQEPSIENIQPDNVAALLQAGIAAARASRSPQSGAGKIRRLDAAKTGQKERARRLLMRVVELDEQNVRGWLWLSTVLDNPDHQRICLENVLALEPGNSQARAGLARLERQAPSAQSDPTSETAESPQSFCPFCRQLISMMTTICPFCRVPLIVDCPDCGTPVDVEAALCGQCGRSMGDFRRGHLYFSQLARTYQEQQQPRKALTAWQAVEALAPDYADLYLYLGQLQVALEQTRPAIASFQRYLAQFPGHPEASLALGQIWHRLHRWDEAEKLYRAALNSSPRFAPLHFALGWLFMEQGLAKPALTHLRRATRLNPQYAEAWLRLAQLYEATQKSSLAVRAYRQVVAFAPPESLAARTAHQRLTVLDPLLPRGLSTSWLELLRQTAGPMLICLLALLLDAGLRPWWIPWTGWLALGLASLGTFLWTSGAALPHNPLLYLVVGSQGLPSTPVRRLVALLGGLCWLAGLLLILLPLGQGWPWEEG